jgi:uncharacterized protein YecE (DUF72 family)
MTGRVHIGTSGWHYDHWKGPFYPAGLPGAGFLEFYVRKFHTVEINNTFYRMPDDKTLVQWRDAVPEGFLFAVKASRFITHMKKLKDAKKPLRDFLKRISMLGKKLGPVLFQLPPRWTMDIERLSIFLDQLPLEHRYAFEFRDPSWFDDKAYEALREVNAAFCIYHLAGLTAPKVVTAGFVYMRLHGPGGAYQGKYSAEGLKAWAREISAWSRQGKDVYCYFDNDEGGYAPQDALRLGAIISSFQS